MSIQHNPIRLCFIPKAFKQDAIKIKAIREPKMLDSYFNPLDLVFLTLENSGFWENKDLFFLNEFQCLFHESHWERQWEEDLLREKERRQLKNEPLSTLTLDKLLCCRLTFNGVTMFFEETDECVHVDRRTLIGNILAQVALHVDLDHYKQYQLYKEYCRL